MPLAETSQPQAAAMPQEGEAAANILAPPSARRTPAFMHPAIFIPAYTMFGILFAVQESLNMRRSGFGSSWLGIELGAWGTQYLMWAITWWLLWRFGDRFIQDLRLSRIITVVVPASLVLCLIEQMLWVLLVPYVPMKQKHMTYWQHVGHTFTEDLAESLSIFWFSFFLIRGIGYYQRLREKESAAAHLETEVANAKLSALRMQLNPHFLFNTMNGISSLMRTDVDAADAMLEQLSSLLRMTLERGDVQLIPLHEEIEFIETYLLMQDMRYAGRVTRKLGVDPSLHDALVPAMFLQPIVENAFAHGISQVDRGELSIEVRREDERVHARVTNSGKGLRPGLSCNGNRRGVGLANVKNRLALHYDDASTLSICEIDPTHVQVEIVLPLQIAVTSAEPRATYALS